MDYELKNGGDVSGRPLTLVLKIGDISNPGSAVFGGGGENINHFFTGRLKCSLSAKKWWRCYLTPSD